MTVIPELAVTDETAARSLLCDVFGFAAQGSHLELGTQVVALRQVSAAPAHGVIDHLAISVPDVDRAAARLLARGAKPDLAVTPDGPRDIAEFWDGGVRYLFLQGPGSARIELCSNLAAPKGPGHDHIGIPCTNVAASQSFCEGLGARLISSVTLVRPEGITLVRFLALGTSILELYQPPGHTAPAASGLWHRLLIPGATDLRGPDGLTIGPT